MATQYTNLFQHRTSTLSLTNGEWAAPRLNDNGELVVEASITLGATIFDLINSDPLAVAIVDSSGDQITSFGGGTQYAEDSAHVSGDTGTMALAVRQDADAAFGADGDYGPLQLDDNGYLKVNIKAGAGSGGTATTDDGAFTAGSGSGTPAMGFFSTDTVDSGDVGVLAMDASRRLLVSIEADNAGIGGGIQYDDGDTDATATGTLIMVKDTNDVVRATLGNADGALVTEAFTAGTVAENEAATPFPVLTGGRYDASPRTLGDGDLGAFAVDADGAVHISDGGNTITVDGTVTANLSATDNAVLDNIDADTSAIQTAVQLIDDSIYIDDADWTDGTSKHMLVGGLYQSTEQSITDGDVGPLSVDANGRLKVSIEADNAGIGGGTQYAEDSAHSSGDTGTMTLAVRDDTTPAALSGTDGDYEPLHTDGNGNLWVTLGTQLDRVQDNVGVALQTDAIMNDTTALTPKFAVISGATSGNNTLVAAVTSKKIRVLSYTIVAAGDVDVRFEDGAGGTALTGVMSLTTNSGVSVAFSPVGHFETTANTLLNMELSAAVQVSGHLAYVEV